MIEILFMQLKYYFVFDGSFCGLLSAVFEALWRGGMPQEVVRIQATVDNLFAQRGVYVASDPNKAERIWSRLKLKLSRPTVNVLVAAHCCGGSLADTHLVRFMFKAITVPEDKSCDFSDADLADLLRYSRAAFIA